MKWTYEVCYNEAKKFEYKRDFYMYSYKAYSSSVRNKWLKEFTWLKKIEKKNGNPYVKYNLPKKYDIKENVYDISKNFTRRVDFRDGNREAYAKSLKTGWIDTYDWIEEPWSSKVKWSYDACKEEAKKYSSRSAFQKGNPTVYIKVLNNGWIDNFEWLKSKRNGSRTTRKWTHETVIEEAKKYSTKHEFIENSWTCYCVSSRNKWLKEFSWLS